MRTEEGRWLEGLDARTERDRFEAYWADTTIFDIMLTDAEEAEREAWAQHLETMDPPEEWEFEAELEQWENRR